MAPFRPFASVLPWSFAAIDAGQIAEKQNPPAAGFSLLHPVFRHQELVVQLRFRGLDRAGTIRVRHNYARKAAVDDVS